MISILALAFMGSQFYKNYLHHSSIFTVEGGSFLRRIFISEIYEFATVILFVYFFSFFAFLVEKVKLKVARNHATRRFLIHAVAHVVMLGFVAVVTWYLLERRYDVSISFRFAVSAHAFVQYMKMVSYLGTNEYLWRLGRELARLKKSENGSSSDGVSRVSAMTQGDAANLSFDRVVQLLAHRGIDSRLYRGEEVKARAILGQLVALDEYRQTVYPRNVNLINFIEFSCLPVLVYEPKYPRTTEIDYVNIIEKFFVIGGIIVFNWFLMEHFILPVVIRTISTPATPSVYAEAMLETMVPLQIFVILCFYVVFECILGANAEVLRMADRETYSDWWNSTTFEEFSRKWNKPVHEFLLRHVHIEAQHWLGLPRGIAAVITFMYSIVAHEVVLLAMFGIFRPYLGFFSIFQIPLWYIMRSPVFQGKVLGNIVFWTCLTIAWPLMTVLYCREYCMQDERNCKIY